MSFEGADGTFGYVATMDIGGYQLVCDCPDVGDVSAVFLAGIPPSFPNYLWDKLLPQTEIPLNLLRQSTIAPLLSAWEAFNVPFNFDATPSSP